jgi:hypothetical protein
MELLDDLIQNRVGFRRVRGEISARKIVENSVSDARRYQRPGDFGWVNHGFFLYYRLTCLQLGPSRGGFFTLLYNLIGFTARQFAQMSNRRCQSLCQRPQVDN